MLGVGAESAAFELMKRRMGMVTEPYSTGRGGRYVLASAEDPKYTVIPQRQRRDGAQAAMPDMT